MGKNVTFQIRILPITDVSKLKCSEGSGTLCLPYISEITNRGLASIQFPLGINALFIKEKMIEVNESLSLKLLPQTGYHSEDE